MFERVWGYTPPRRILTSVLALFLLLTLTVGASASDFEVSYPETVSIYVKPDGGIVYPAADRAKIINLGTTAVRVTKVQLLPKNGWEYVTATPVDKQFTLKLRGDLFTETRHLLKQSKLNWVILPSTELRLNFDCSVPEGTQVDEPVLIAQLKFWVGTGSVTEDEIGSGEVFSITFEEAEGGTVVNKTPLQTGMDSKVPELPEVTPDFGYLFDHWEDSDGTMVKQGDVLWDDVKLHPVFTEREYVDFTLTEDNLNMIGYTSSKTNWAIPATFTYDGVDYKTVGISDNLFKGNTNLRHVTIPATVNYLGDKAFYQSSLTSVTIKSDIDYIGYYCFGESPNLSTVNLPDNLTSLSNSMFRKCAIAEVVIPAGVKEIPAQAFYDNDLRSVKIYGAVTVGDWAFAQNQKLSSIYLPTSLKSVAYDGFQLSVNTEVDPSIHPTIYYAGSQSQWDDISWDSGNRYVLTYSTRNFNYTY